MEASQRFSTKNGNAKKMPTTAMWIHDDTCCMKPNLPVKIQLSQWNHITRDKAPKIHGPVDGVVGLPSPTPRNSRNRDTGNFILEHTSVTDDSSMKKICMAAIRRFFPASSQSNFLQLLT